MSESITTGRPPGPTDGGFGFVSVLTGFCHELRSEGMAVGTGDAIAYCEASAVLDPTDLVDLYWAGRASLLTRHDDLPTYDRVFRAYFLDAGAPVQEMLKIKAQATAEVASALDALDKDEMGEEEEQDEAPLGIAASNIETLKQKSFAELTPEERQEMRRLMARFQLTPPTRRTRRTRPSHHGRRLDWRRTMRSSMRTQGEIVRLYRRERRLRRRPLILILDISGSMADYSRALLQFAYSAKRASVKGTTASKGVEVFCFGTRLTRVTDSLEKRSPDKALDEASERIFDWEGGTRIGDSLEEFVQEWGRGGLCRGGIIVICSDGLDRGDPQTLADAMERLSRLSHRIVWMNPHKGDDPDYKAQTMGMMASEPYIDELLSGHDLASLEELAGLLPKLG